MSHRKEKKREYEIGERPAMPRGMGERAIKMIPAPRVVNEDHQRNGRAAENIDGGVAVGVQAVLVYAPEFSRP